MIQKQLIALNEYENEDISNLVFDIIENCSFVPKLKSSLR